MCPHMTQEELEIWEAELVREGWTETQVILTHVGAGSSAKDGCPWRGETCEGGHALRTPTQEIAWGTRALGPRPHPGVRTVGF